MNGFHKNGARRLYRARVGSALAALAFAGALIAAACNNDTVDVAAPAVAAKLLLSAGDGQVGRVADPALTPLSVEVHDTRGLPMAGAEVTFTTTGNGSFSNSVAVSDSDGVATVLYTYGTVEGDYTIRATTAGVADTISFVLHANPGVPLAVETLTGAAQNAPAGATLDTPLTVEVLDLFGNAIAGATVTWSVDGGGTLSSPTSVTDANGKAQVTLTLGATAGTETVTAHIENVPDAVFLETAK